MAAGGGSFCVKAGVHYFLVEHSSGGRARVDYVLFQPVENSVAPSSWGAIKGLYR